LVGDPNGEEELSYKFRTIQSNATLQIAWLMFSIIKNGHLLFCRQISLDQNLMLSKQNKTKHNVIRKPVKKQTLFIWA
jgi:hypothetical protein